jgi:hypothetical protein
MRTALNLALSSALLACGGGGGATSFGATNPGVTSAPEQTETSVAESSSSTPPHGSSTSTSSTSSTSASSSGSDMIWDMGMPDFGPQQPAGCEGKIDFLFAISAGGNMVNDQERLLTSFPGFIDAIEDQFTDFDVHLLVANPNHKPGWIMGDCSLCMDDCDPQAFPPFCGATLTPCDKKIGAGVTYPAGANASNRRCELAGGRRYIVSGEQDMKDAFACVAQVGSGGGAATAEAMVAALQPAINDPDNEFACNGGFLRKDALLVVTIIQDTYDQDSLGTVDEWIEALRAAKNYDDDAFAVLVLTTDVDVGYQQLCLPNQFNTEKNRLRLLANGVKHGFIDSICQPSYTDFFAKHVGHLVDLCDDFVAPG